MITYLDDRFPEDISLGAIGGPEYKTDIITSISGVEQRNIKWGQPRIKYNVSYGIKTKQQIEKLIAFFRTKKGKAMGFRFKDWSDYAAINSIIGIGDGVKRSFQLIKQYKSANYIENRVITKPVYDSVKIFQNSDLISSEKYKIDYYKGIITFDYPPASGEQITASFEFDVYVRFDNDHLPISIDDHGIYSCHNITLIEIKSTLNPI